MTIYGWLVMFGSVGAVVTLMSWCFYKALTVPQETEKLHGYDAAESPMGDE